MLLLQMRDATVAGETAQYFEEERREHQSRHCGRQVYQVCSAGQQLMRLELAGEQQ
jgi:hypothetical protein